MYIIWLLHVYSVQTCQGQYKLNLEQNLDALTELATNNSSQTSTVEQSITRRTLITMFKSDLSSPLALVREPV